MKNRVRPILLALCALVMMAGAVFAELKKGYYSPAELGTLRQPAPPDSSQDAVYQVSAYPVPAADLAPGDGLQDVRIYCGTCHSPAYITMQPPLPAATWEAELNKMNKTFGAAIPDPAARRILLYLQSHYTPDTRKP